MKRKKRPPLAAGWLRIFYLWLAGFFFVLGVIGALLPIMPTVPFLLLTSYFLLRSSRKLNILLLRTKWFGPPLRDWQEKGGVRLKAKLQGAALIVISFSISLYFHRAWPALQLLLVSMAIVALVIIWRVPTVRDDEPTK